MTYLNFNRDKIPKSDSIQIQSTGDDGGTRCKCGCSEYELQSPTEAGLVLQLVEGSEGEKDQQSV